MDAFIVRQTEVFEKWLRKLRDVTAKAKILVRIRRTTLGNLGDCKAVGGGVEEMRIPYGPGYRLYFTRSRGTVILLLVGGEKSTQRAHIARGKRMAREIGD